MQGAPQRAAPCQTSTPPSGRPLFIIPQGHVPESFLAWWRATAERAGPKSDQERTGGTAITGSTQSTGGKKPTRPGSPSKGLPTAGPHVGLGWHCCFSGVRWGAE